MAVKTAQARINLANTIESLLGYPIIKVGNNEASLHIPEHREQ